MHFLKILFKNAFRHKLRTGLTILGITIALVAFGLRSLSYFPTPLPIIIVDNSMPLQ